MIRKQDMHMRRQGYIRHIEDAQRGARLHLEHPYEVIATKQSLQPLKHRCHCGKPTYHANLCPDCLYQVPFIVFSLADSGSLMSHPPTTDAQWLQRQEYWWYQDCIHCHLGAMSLRSHTPDGQIPRRAACKYCLAQYHQWRSAYRQHCVECHSPLLAAVVTHYRQEAIRLEQQLQRHAGHHSERILLWCTLAKDYHQLVTRLEDAAVCLPGWDFPRIVQALEQTIIRKCPGTQSPTSHQERINVLTQARDQIQKVVHSASRPAKGRNA